MKVLILDDETRILDELGEFLRRQKHLPTCVNTPSAALTILQKESFDLMILDIRLPEMDGIEVLKKVKADWPSLEVIMISGHGDMDTVIEAMRFGACDYLRKPFRQNDLEVALKRSARIVGLKQEVNKLTDDNSLITRELERRIEKNFVGESTAIRKVIEDSLRLAAFPDTPLIITGESGTGKEIIARIIHFASPRKEARFFPINCAALPENLIESEFFGFKRGTFTGAVQDKKGILELSQSGSVFLDEIGEMPLVMQSKLLRVLEEKKFMKLGASNETAVDVRFIAATNRDPEAQIADQSFRQDLYYRLAAFRIQIPPLRERPEDIEPLLLHFTNEFCSRYHLKVPRIDQDLLCELQQYPFPGNARELRNLVERALIINRDERLGFDDFPDLNIIPQNHESALDKSQKQIIEKALAEVKHNQSQAAKNLGISRFTLIRKMKKYDLA